MHNRLRQNAIIVLATLICTSFECLYSQKVTEIEQTPTVQSYHSPAKQGPHNYIKAQENQPFPSYMKNVDDLTYRIPIQSDIIKPPYPLIIIETGFFALSASLDNLQDYYASHGFLVAGVNNTSHFNLICAMLHGLSNRVTDTIP